jgi:hypothetical protein
MAAPAAAPTTAPSAPLRMADSAAAFWAVWLPTCALA